MTLLNKIFGAVTDFHSINLIVFTKQKKKKIHSEHYINFQAPTFEIPVCHQLCVQTIFCFYILTKSITVKYYCKFISFVIAG